ncbi:hypothetical protein [Pedobacter sp. MW01-1-1]|uniref:hypothetical protein n=1 Tax=Pedobacter sp. MW01-1-1 TaxID=3383027 RepID=UPI003FEEBDE3
MRTVKNILLLGLFTSFYMCCKPKSDNTVVYSCNGDYFSFDKTIEEVSDSLKLIGITLEYNNSFSGEDLGVKMYSYQEINDSMVIERKLYFKDERLQAIILDFTSLSIDDKKKFKEIINNRFKKCDLQINSNYTKVSYFNQVNPLESLSGETFHLKIFYNEMHRQLPLIF